jgi:DNA polymerase-1
MIDIHKEMRAKHLKSVMILQVHDELVFDAVEEELDLLNPLILSGMKQALVLPNAVPVEAAIGAGKNWLEAH